MDETADRIWVTVGGVTLYRLYISGNGTLARMTRQERGGPECEMIPVGSVSAARLTSELRRLRECAFEVAPSDGEDFAAGRADLFETWKRRLRAC